MKPVPEPPADFEVIWRGSRAHRWGLFVGAGVLLVVGLGLLLGLVAIAWNGRGRTSTDSEARLLLIIVPMSVALILLSLITGVGFLREALGAQQRVVTGRLEAVTEHSGHSGLSGHYVQLWIRIDGVEVRVPEVLRPHLQVGRRVWVRVGPVTGDLRCFAARPRR